MSSLDIMYILLDYIRLCISDEQIYAHLITILISDQ